MARFTVTPHPPAHAPGWSVDPSESRSYQLWAPRPGRAQYAASWDRRGGHVGSFRRADTAEDALACFPDDTEGRRAKAALLDALKQHEAAN